MICRLFAFRKRSIAHSAVSFAPFSSLCFQLEDLMARTNYKETAKLISQFSEKKKPMVAAPPQGTPPKMGPNGQPLPGQQQHQQQLGGKPGQGFATPGQQGSKTMPASAFAAAQMRQQQMQQQQHMMQHQQGGAPAGGQLHPGAHLQPPTPFRPSESSPQAPAPVRTKLDKLLDFVLNDGPSNKYALICPGCYGHNGLVQEADLGKLRWKCAMCGRINGPPPPPPPPPSQQPQHHSGAGGAAGHLHMSPQPPQTPAGKDGTGGAGHMPLTPFAPLSSTPSREVRSHSLDSRTEVDPAHMLQREHALAEVDDETEADAAPPAMGSRNSRANSRRGSERKEADDAAIAAARSAAASEAGSDSDGGFEEVHADGTAAAAPRKRKGAQKK